MADDKGDVQPGELTDIMERVPVKSEHLQELVSRLSDRRLAVERELATLGEEKRGMNDVFRQCRSFERAYSAALNEAAVAFKIRAVVEGNLPETLRRIPIEKRFNKAYVQAICREADGVQPHLVSPERGIRRLVAEAMKLTEEHVHRFVDEVHGVLAETARDAARRSVALDAGALRPPGSAAADAGGAPPGVVEHLRLRGFENAVIMAATQALEAWRAEAHRVAAMMVQMECDYVTPSAFREMERAWQAERELPGAAPLEGGAPEPGPGGERLAALAAGRVSEDAEAFDAGDDSDGEGTEPPTPSPSRGGAAAAAQAQAAAAARRGDLKAGWLEKRAGDASTLSTLPVDSWRWQRRWFVAATEAGYLYYFSSPDDVGSGKAPRVSVNLRQCVVEDFQPEAAGVPANRRSTAASAGGAVSLLIRISHRDPAKAIAKAHSQMVLRAADAADKFEWLARLRAAAGGDGGKAAGAQPSGAAALAVAARGGGRPAAPASHGLFGRAKEKLSNFSGFGSSKLSELSTPGAVEDLDAYYERLGTFCGLYARSVFDRMAKTVPKAIILCQVIRSRDRLLDQLHDYLSSLKPAEVDMLLAEDPSLARRRAAAQAAAKDLAAAVREVQRAQEARAAAAGDGPGALAPREAVSVRALLLAGAYPLVPADRVPPQTSLARLYGEFTPAAIALAPGDAKPKLGKPLGARAGENGAPAAAAAGGAPASPTAAGAAKPRRAAPPPPPAAK